MRPASPPRRVPPQRAPRQVGDREQGEPCRPSQAPRARVTLHRRVLEHARRLDEGSSVAAEEATRARGNPNRPGWPRRLLGAHTAVSSPGSGMNPPNGRWWGLPQGGVLRVQPRAMSAPPIVRAADGSFAVVPGTLRGRQRRHREITVAAHEPFSVSLLDTPDVSVATCGGELMERGTDRSALDGRTPTSPGGVGASATPTCRWARHQYPV
jgi:hypothetical protein